MFVFRFAVQQSQTVYLNGPNLPSAPKTPAVLQLFSWPTACVGILTFLLACLLWVKHYISRAIFLLYQQGFYPELGLLSVWSFACSPCIGMCFWQLGDASVFPTFLPGLLSVLSFACFLHVHTTPRVVKYTIKGVFLPHTLCSKDRLQIHLHSRQDKVLTGDEWMDYGSPRTCDHSRTYCSQQIVKQIMETLKRVKQSKLEGHLV